MLKGKERSKRTQIYQWLTMLVLVSMLFSLSATTALAKGNDPEEPRASSQSGFQTFAATNPTNSAGIATANPNGAHSTYAWPIAMNQMGWNMQSYQNYGSTAANAYFHHGVDFVTNNYGVNVYAVSGGRVVNIQNYTPGNVLYWEVAILDNEGYVWQYHHIDTTTIPQAIKDAYAAWQANHANGYIAPGTLIGKNVQWTVYTFGYYFHHIHLNILAAGDVYINPLEFLSMGSDTTAPEIQAIGLLKSNTVTSGTAVSGDYGLYVRARDLYQSTVYYMPPYKYEFALDGGDWTTVWEFHTFPGGSNDYTFVNDFFVNPPTKGDYSTRDFYIDLGFTTSGQRAFPSTAGSHTIQVRVSDYNGNSATSSFSYNYYKTYENTTSASISDNGCSAGTGVTKTFNVTDDMLVSDLNVGLNLTHATRGQLKVTLKAPGDASATTIVNTSSDSYDNYDVLVDDASTSSINDGSNDTVASPYYDRSAGPSTNASLDAFTGKSALGTWTMFICDGTSATTGTVNRVKLDLLGTTNTNHAPVAAPQSVTTNEDTAKGITLTGSDADNDPLTFSVTSAPSHGTLSGTTPNLTYTPAANYNGSDSFQFVANDGKVNSAAATVSLTVNPVNDAPLANAQSVTTNEDAALAITLTGSDVDGNLLTYVVLTQPGHGSLSGTIPALTYTPALNYNGPDSFTFKVNDGTVDSAPATVSIGVNPVNDPPVANPQSLSTAEDTPLVITLTGSDIDSGSLTFTITAQPAHGALSGTAPSLTYTPAADYNGTDSFQFVANDGLVSSAPATIDLTISAVNDAPVADSQSILTQQDLPVEISLTGSDVDGDSLTFAVTAGPDHGTLSGMAPDLTYTPLPGYIGADGFTFVANDGALDSAPATVSIAVTRTNHQPVADGQSVSTPEDTALAITLTGSDPDSDPLTFAVVTLPANGSLSGSAPNLTYIPAADFNGSDSFTFVANDGLVDSLTATVAIEVSAVNDAPVANDQAVSLAEDGSVAITLSGSDVEGDALTLIVVGGPEHGTLSGTAPSLTYTPAADYNGPDGFTFIAYDGILYSTSGTVSITVTPVNDAPVANGQSVTTAEDTARAITLSGADVENSALSYSIVLSPSHGTLSGTAPNLTYTPAANYNGLDSFTFKVNDGALDSAPAVVSITVSAVNDAPVANAQPVTTAQDTAKAITLSGSDVDGDALTYAVASSPSHGTLSGSAPALTYTPASGYSGSDSFTFTVNDGTVSSSPAIVSITITPSGPVTVFSDNFTSNLGWTRNPSGTDTATTGLWERGVPAATNSSGAKQLVAYSASYDLVTGPLAGAGAGDYDIDSGNTTIRSPNIVLPAGKTITLTLKYYLAHGSNSSSSDYLRIKVVGATTTTMLQELGATNDDDAAWATLTYTLTSYAGQTVYILIEAADASGASLVEAAVDDVVITAQ